MSPEHTIQVRYVSIGTVYAYIYLGLRLELGIKLSSKPSVADFAYAARDHVFW